MAANRQPDRKYPATATEISSNSGGSAIKPSCTRSRNACTGTIVASNVSR